MAEQEAGWRNDPYGRFQQRYFNGTAWTEHVATGGEQQVDPLGASTVIPIATPPTAFAAGGKRAGVIKFLDAAGPDSRERPQPSLRAAVAGLGGAVLAGGVLTVVLGDNASRGVQVVTSLAIIAVAWALRSFVKLVEVQAGAVGMVVVAIPAFAVAATVSDGSGSNATGFVMAALFIAAWAFRGFKARNLLLALGALALVSSFGSLISDPSVEQCQEYIDNGDFESFDDECSDVDPNGATSFLPTQLTDNVGNEGTIYLIGGALYLGLTWWLDRRGHRGTGTAFAGAGLVSTLVGVSMLASDFGETWAPLFVLVVGLIVAFVGSHGARRATTWWGALLTAIATIWFVAVQWEPDSSGAIGAVLIVAGVVLVAIPLIDDPFRKALRARNTGGSTPTPPPPDSSGS
ncbi:MAG: DUF2510 domain-containing protein [Ilumatobacteraceae bacterium]